MTKNELIEGAVEVSKGPHGFQLILIIGVMMLLAFNMYYSHQSNTGVIQALDNNTKVLYELKGFIGEIKK